MIKRENSFTSHAEGKVSGSTGAFDEDVQVGYKNQRATRYSSDIVNDLYYGNDFFKRIVDEIPSDSLKKGFEIKFSPEDENLSKKIMDLFVNFELDNYLVDFMQSGRKDGFSALLPICKVKGDLATDEVLDLRRLDSIIDFNVIKREDVLRVERNKDSTKPFYREIEYVYIKKHNDVAIKYHRSWLLIFETGTTLNRNVTDTMHETMYTGLLDALQVYYNVMHSTGQYAFASFCKHLQIGDQTVLNKIKNDGLDAYTQKKAMQIDSTSLLVTGTEDKLSSVNLGANTDFESLQKVSINDIAMRVGIPVSKLMGASAGALASAEQDSDKYIEVVEQFQDVIVKDFLRKVINMILAITGNYDKKYDIEFNSIKAKDKKKEAEENKLEAEKDKIKAEALKIKMETLISMNKELNDSSISEAIKKLANKLKDSILEDLDLDED
ncbi:anti-CBASS protein Acb1 family protein [Cetobacterium sp.]|uniref:anti-CBASS protein Acb1 family protein n=1 Tax=Cetobacterium sp. TaxID=2071632 RepID=UPI003F2D0A67